MQRKCWAQKIGKCEGGLTKEHYISHSLKATKSIRIQGLPFCAEEYVSIPWTNAAANILCKKHNNLLSPLDAEARKFKDSLNQMAGQNSDLTTSNDPFLGPKKFLINGLLLKRWFVKTYCNVFVMQGDNPTPEFVQYVFDPEKAPTVRIGMLPVLGQVINVQEGHIAILPASNMALLNIDDLD